MASRLLAGASGYSFKEWKGTFYPGEDEARGDARLLLRAPADGGDQQHLLPHAQASRCSRTGQAATPEDFRFAIKASRRITHMSRLKAESSAEPVELPLQEPRGARRQARAGALPAAAEPEEGPAAPGRRSSPLLPAGPQRRVRVPQRELVRRRGVRRAEGRGRRAVLSEREDNAPPPLVETAPWGYVRLRLESYSDADLAQVGRDGSRPRAGREIFVYFMHEPTAPAYAATLVAMLAGRGADRGRRSSKLPPPTRAPATCSRTARARA